LAKKGNSILNRLIKASGNKYAAAILDCDVYDITDYYDTGSYMMNMLLSGDMFRGMPAGKVFELSGETGTGKSYLAMAVLFNFVKTSKNNYVWLHESEKSILQEKIRPHLTEEENQRFVVAPVVHLEELITESANLMKEFKAIKEETPEINLMYSLDSLGMLTSRVELEKAIKGDESKVMSKQAKIAAYFNLISMDLAKMKIPFIYTNHLYLDIMKASQKYVKETDKHITSGGKGVMFCPDVKIRLMKKRFKDEDTGIQSGITVKAIPTKSRFIASDISKIEFQILFKVGMDRYSGLFEFLENHDLLQKKRMGPHGTELSIPECGFKTTTKEMKGKPKSEFFTKEVLEFINKKFQSLYLLESQEDTKFIDGIEGAE